MNKRIGFVIVAVAALFVAASCSKPDAVSGATAWEPGQAAETIAVEALSVSKAPLVDDVRASGVVAGVREAFVVAET